MRCHFTSLSICKSGIYFTNKTVLSLIPSDNAAKSLITSVSEPWTFLQPLTLGHLYNGNSAKEGKKKSHKSRFFFFFFTSFWNNEKYWTQSKSPKLRDWKIKQSRRMCSCVAFSEKSRRESNLPWVQVRLWHRAVETYLSGEYLKWNVKEREAPRMMEFSTFETVPLWLAVNSPGLGWKRQI